jgi:hypothetical protein
MRKAHELRRMVQGKISVPPRCLLNACSAIWFRANYGFGFRRCLRMGLEQKPSGAASHHSNARILEFQQCAVFFSGSSVCLFLLSFCSTCLTSFDVRFLAILRRLPFGCVILDGLAPREKFTKPGQSVHMVAKYLNGDEDGHGNCGTGYSPKPGPEGQR